MCSKVVASLEVLKHLEDVVRKAKASNRGELIAAAEAAHSAYVTFCMKADDIDMNLSKVN